MVRQRTHDDTRRHVTRTFTLAVVASVAIVIVSAMLLTESSPTWLGAVIAGIAAIPALVALRVGAINFAHRDGVERAVILRSTSIAFFATMATVLTYGLFESFADLPAASSRAFYSVGMATWAG